MGALVCEVHVGMGVMCLFVRKGVFQKCMGCVRESQKFMLNMLHHTPCPILLFELVIESSPSHGLMTKSLGLNVRVPIFIWVLGSEPRSSCKLYPKLSEGTLRDSSESL